MKRLKRELEPFDNMWEQNLAIYGVVLFSALLIEFIVNIDLVHRLVSLFFPMSHYYTMFNGLVVYLFFILPWRPVRRFIWNELFVLIVKRLNKPAKGKIEDIEEFGAPLTDEERMELKKITDLTDPKNLKKQGGK